MNIKKRNINVIILHVFSYRTRKQKVSHHSKMDIECQKDSVAFLRLISSQKEIINKLIKDNKIHDIEKIKHINNKIAFMKKNISISDYAQMICKGSIQIKEESNSKH